MPGNVACPEVREWTRYLTGETADAQASTFEQHALQCPDCAQVLDRLTAEDELVTAMRAPETLPDEAERALLDTLSDRLRRMRPSTPPLCEEMSPTLAIDTANLKKTVALEIGDVLAPAMGPEEIGRLGDYPILNLLGSGGMGLVFQAKDVQLERLVAIKVMKARLAAQPSYRQRFLREARSVAALNHDHVVTIHHVAEQKGVPYLVMPLLQGESLETRLKREGVVPLAETLRVGREIAEGLAAAHASGLIHRDIKPSNIWLETVGHVSNVPGLGTLETCPTTRVKILDFGLARAVDTNDGLTSACDVLGTPGYMAPEQACGKTVNARADLFSLGVLLYRMGTGTAPFKADTVSAALLAVQQTTPVPPAQLDAEIPLELSRLIMQLLAKRAEERPESAQAVVQAIRALERDRVADASPAPALTRWPWWTVVRVLGGVILAAVLLPQIIIRITNRQGEQTTIQLPPDNKVVIEKNGKILAQVPAGAEAKKLGENPTPPASRLPLSPLALVSQPAALPSVESWRLETRHHRGRVLDARYQPKGDLLATAGDDGMIRLWNPADGWLVRILVGHEHRVHSLNWAPDGATLASMSFDGTTRLWEAKSGRLLHALPGPLHWAYTPAAWSPDGQKVATVARDGPIVIWEAKTGKPLKTFAKPKNFIALSWAGGKQEWLAVAAIDKTVQLWDPATGECLRTFKTENPATVAWSPDGTFLAIGPGHAKVRIWKASTDQFLETDIPEYGGYCLAWSRDGKTLAVGGNSPTVRFWQPNAKPDPRIVWSGNTNSVDWSADDRTLACNKYDDVYVGAQLIAVDKPNSMVTIPTWRSLGADALAGNQDGSVLASSCHYDKTRVWTTASGMLSQSFPLSSHMSAMALSPDGRILAFAGEPGTKSIGLRDVTNGRTLETLAAHEDRVLAIAFSPDGKRLASGSRDKTVRVWDAVTAKVIHTLSQHQEEVRQVCWSPNGKYLASISRTKVHVFEADSGKLLRSWEPDGRSWSQPSVLAWSTDSTLLAVAQPDSQDIGLYSIDSETPLAILKGHEASITATTWLADGKTLVSVSKDRTLRLWDGRAGQLLRTVDGMTDADRCSVAGHLLAASTDSYTLRLWDMASGRPHGTIIVLRNQGKDHYVTVSADGHYRGSPAEIEKELVYVVRTADGQQTLSLTEFAQRYGWKNQPEKVRMIAD